MQTRLEHDSMGQVEVPRERLWGAQTQRALTNFPHGRDRVPMSVIRAIALIKQAAAMAHVEASALPREKGEAIARAAEEVLAGAHDQEFPLSVWQTGSGTQTHMNVNEVLANRASELLGGPRGQGRKVHPNDDVNLGQSSNDVFPSALHFAAAEAIVRSLLPSVELLAQALTNKAEAFRHIVKVGRTHLQDATPLTLGQELSGYAAQLRGTKRQVELALPRLYELALGGTAVGTGLNAMPGIAERIAQELARRTGLPFTCAPNRFEAVAGGDAIVGMHGAFKALACALYKIANDLRWLASGPRAGLGELNLPANEPGSSIMPGKVNPTQSEALMMRCAQVIGNDGAVTLGGMGGQFELNTFRPLFAQNLLGSCELLTEGCDSFRVRCIEGMTPNEGRIRELVERSLMLATALTPHIGYDQAAAIARRALAEGKTLREVAVSSGMVRAEEFDAWVRPETMVGVP